MLKTKQFGENNSLTWVVIDSEKTDLSNIAIGDYQLDTEAIAYALDKDERAHIDFDSENGRLLLVFNALKLDKDDNHYETIPVTFIAYRDQLMTIVNQENNYIVALIEQFMTRYQMTSTYQLLFAGLTILSNRYFPVMDEIDRDKDKLNAALRRETTKKNLLALSDLETGSVYLLAAANQNVLLLEQLKLHPRLQMISSHEREQLDDALIEARQLASMSQLHSQILQQLSSAYNNVLNNNLNENLTTLNIISILLAVVAVFTGFFGMNVPLPWTNKPQAWIWICLIALACYIVLGIVLRKYMKRK